MATAALVTPSFECSTVGCTAATSEHYCAEHSALCIYCDGEHERGELDERGACSECRRSECDDELEMFAGAQCWCGHHGAQS